MYHKTKNKIKKKTKQLSGGGTIPKDIRTKKTYYEGMTFIDFLQGNELIASIYVNNDWTSKSEIKEILRRLNMQDTPKNRELLVKFLKHKIEPYKNPKKVVSRKRKKTTSEGFWGKLKQGLLEIFQ